MKWRLWLRLLIQSISNNILLLILPWICLSYLLLINYRWLLNIHRGSRWTFWGWNLIALRANSFNLRVLNCLRLLIFGCVWNYWWFWWNYLLRLCKVLINAQSILAVSIFSMFLIKINAFRIGWLKPLLYLHLSLIILGFFISNILSRDYKCLRLLIY